MNELQDSNLTPKELTVLSVTLGIIISIILTAANVYLGLYAGMTISASIPASVMAMGVFNVMLRKKGLHQSNIVQTMASAGSSLSAGIIFTIPALVLVGAWTEFDFWSTTLIAFAGGLLGVIFMIPLRKALIVDDETLTYPEGVACAAVLKVGSETGGQGFYTILKGLAIGGIFKYFVTGAKLIQGTVERAFFAGERVWYVGSDISPALLAIGYIVKLEVAALVLLGGLIGWTIGIPTYTLGADILSGDAIDAAWNLWSTKIRYLGVGAMLVGGIWSIISVRKGIVSGLSDLKNTYTQGAAAPKERTEVNMGLMPMFVIFILCLVIMFALYKYLIGALGFTILTTAIMVVLGFIFVAVSSYVVGLVGSSNNPVSGMTISVLLVTSALFLVLGLTGDSAILATLGVAAIVCCAACSAADMSQDLKTGRIIGATPRSQQWAAIIGVAVSAAFIAPVLTLLHSAYVIGEGLKAPQAALFASITNALFGDGNLPYTMVIIGIIGGIIVIFLDTLLQKRGSKFRLYLMPLAVGIYLPITLAVPMFMGGLLRYVLDRSKPESEVSDADNGVLFSSGLIAGESLMGVILAVFIYLKFNMGWNFLSSGWTDVVSIIALLGLTYWLYRQAKK